MKKKCRNSWPYVVFFFTEPYWVYLRHTYLNPQKIDSIDNVWKEVASLRITVPLSMFCLNAASLNDHLCECTERLKTRIVMFQVEENRKLNKGYKQSCELKFFGIERTIFNHFSLLRICEKYTEIRNTARSSPKTTEELVTLINYVKKSSDVTICRIIDEIETAAHHLSFVVDYATLSGMQYYYKSMK